MEEKRQQQRRGQPGGLGQKFRNMLRALGLLVMHPTQKAKDEYRDTGNERDRRDRRARRDAPRDEDRRNRARRS